MKRYICIALVLLLITGCTNHPRADKENSIIDNSEANDELSEQTNVNLEDSEEKKESMSAETKDEEKIYHRVDTLEDAIEATGIHASLNDVFMMYHLNYYVTEKKEIEIVIDDSILSGSVLVSNEKLNDNDTDFDLVYVDKNDVDTETVIHTKMRDKRYLMLIYEKDNVNYRFIFDDPINQNMADWLFSSARYIVGREENENGMTVYYDNQLFSYPIENGINGTFINTDDIKCRWGEFKKNEIAIVLQENGMIYVGIPQSDGLFMFGKYANDGSGFYAFYGSEVKENLPGGDGPRPPVDLSDQTILGYFIVDEAMALTLYDQNKDPYVNGNHESAQFYLSEY